MKKLLIIAISSVSCICAMAQGTAMLNVSQDPVSLARGNAGVTMEASAWALDNNPASMSLAQNRGDAALGYTMWTPASSHVAALGAFYRIDDRFAVGLSGRYFIEKTITEVSSDGFTRTSFRPSDMYFAVGTSCKIIDGFSAGLNARFISSHPASAYKGFAFAVDLGLQYRIAGFTAGLGVNNLGTKMKLGDNKSSLPGILEIGAAYDHRFGKFGLGINAGFDYLFSNAIMAGVGLQADFNEMIYLRGGYHYGNAGSGKSTSTANAAVIPSYASVGLGAQFKGVHLDVAYLTASKVLGNTICLSLGYRF